MLSVAASPMGVIMNLNSNKLNALIMDLKLSDYFYVNDSTIHGKGLFAKTHIEPGRYLGEYKGPPSTDVDTYVLWTQDENDRWIARDGRNMLRYINHSPDPCAEFCGFELYATKLIEPGSEITVDYGEDAVSL